MLKNRSSISSYFEDSLDEFKSWMQVQRIGCSFEDWPIYGLRWGSGSTKIFLWATTNGQDKTSLKGILTLMKLLQGKEPDVVSFGTLIKWKSKFTLYFIPVLNPDGLNNFCSENAMGIDIYKDARSLIAPESQVLDAALKDYKPDMVIGLENISMAALQSSKSRKKLMLLDLATDQHLYANSKKSTQNESRQRLIAACNTHAEKLKSCIGIINNDYDKHHFSSLIQQNGTPMLLIRPMQEFMNTEELKMVNLVEKTLVYLLNQLSVETKNTMVASNVGAEAIISTPMNADIIYKKAKITANNGKRFIADVAFDRRPSGYELKKIGDLDGATAKEILLNQILKLEDLSTFRNN